MINFLAIFLNNDGAIVRDNDTAEVMNIQLGEFDSKDTAIQQAMVQLGCVKAVNNVILKGQNKGGFMVVDAQEFATV
ncbi:hypothetical protein [Grimontia sp. NTOU-MAR1]|uniref:hypothetical protein n=1 Tax=Grimontia sp. NTOU-MAR1 TaxID=3111011 RepID=UPI002DBF2A96|nr:hypothetical protein [Grimontia sp. NTOU-MAR1]WRV96501.1 hypothetical protein VP504_10305 [Grimontia sp. NTOU-MAR1]